MPPPIVSGGKERSGPAQPSTIPNVAGNYTGTTNIVIPQLLFNFTCPATPSVTQTGANVTLSPVPMSGACANNFPTRPGSSFTIDTTGSLGPATENGIPFAACNGTYTATASGGFVGNTLEISLVYTAASGGCAGQLASSFSISINASD
jgi:hypothetical protein